VAKTYNNCHDKNEVILKTIIQRVSHASVTIDQKIVAKIDQGLLILLGICDSDTATDIDYLVQKIVNLRIFDDQNQVMNLSVKDVNGDIILVSQFTLYAATKKGNRPSYIAAARPEIAVPIYNHFIKKLENQFGKKIQTGVFGADMKVALLNDGPVTITIDSNNK
jgi:D-tyrosyl-tRNA(Tyr) deacylase